MSLEATGPVADPRPGPGEVASRRGASLVDGVYSETRIFSVLSQYAVMQVVLACSGLVRNKIVASRLGPTAFGEISQIAAIVAVAITLVSFGMSVSLSRNVARSTTLEERRQHLENANAIVMCLSCAAVLALLALLAGGRLLALAGLTPSRTATWGAVLFVAAIPFEGLTTNYLALLQGILDVKGLAVGRSIAVLLATALAVPVVWFFGFIGAAVQFLLLSVFVSVLLGRRCRALGYSPLRIRFARRTATVLASFGMISMASSFAQVFADAAVRARLIEAAGPTANGLLQAPYVLAMALKTIVLASIGSVSLATIAPRVDRREISAAVDRLLNVVIPLGTAALGALGLLGVHAMTLLYSRAFGPSAGFFPWLLSADLLLVFVWVIGAPILAYGDRTLWLALDLIFAAARWTIAVSLLPRFGSHAVVVGYLAGIGLHTALTLGLYLKRYRLRLASTHLVRLSFGLVFVVALSITGARPSSSLAVSAALACWLAYFVFHARRSGILVAVRARLLQQG